MKQFVSTNKRAWHAGESSFQGKNNCNDFSIGIELEGTDNSAFEDVQYSKLIELTRTLMQNYPKLIKTELWAIHLLPQEESQILEIFLIGKNINLRFSYAVI